MGETCCLYRKKDLSKINDHLYDFNLKMNAERMEKMIKKIENSVKIN